VVDLDEAVALATRELREIERPDLPLRLDDPEKTWAERPWCYVFGFNSVAYLDHGQWDAMVPSGPIVVNKDGSGVWVLPSALPRDEALDLYEREHGLG
jgi:hypothetical protein